MALAQEVRVPDPAPAVLVVDDDPAARRLCRHLLQRDGYTVMEAENGTEALQIVAKDRPHTVVLDVSMPGMDGMECARRLKSDPLTGDIPVIMVTAQSSASDIVAGLEAGADEYLTKPLNHKEFLLRVRSMVRYRIAWLDLQHHTHIQAQQANTLSLLLDFSHRLASADRLDHILQLTLAVTLSITRCTRASIMLPDRQGRYLEIAGSLGLEQESAKPRRVSVGTGIAGQVFSSGKLWIADTPDAVPSRHQGDDTFPLGGFPAISAPLTAAESTVGVLNVAERTDRTPFHPKELQYLDLVCNYAATAIDDTLTRTARDEARDSVVFALAKLAEQRDNDTGRHVERMVKYCLMLAARLRRVEKYAQVIDDRFLESLERAAPLHDIGKVAIPDRILLKSGKLTPEEFAVMRTHADIGAETIRSVLGRAPGSDFLQMAAEIARHHHEWYDGAGYPDGLRGSEIPLTARIAALADVYDALTSKRIYKEAWTHDRAAAEIAALSGTQLDPDLVECFFEIEDDFKHLAEKLADPLEDAKPPKPPRRTGLQPEPMAI
jgi:response regulator RpfG family c-di-GMP phosphodiesterase